jgi:hypothetical protein
MRRFRRLRLSPSMVVASLALLVALGGTSMAAATLVIPRASVGLLQLKANSVNSSKVVNGSLLRADFRAGQIPRGLTGPSGPAGPAGPQGPAGAAGSSGVAAPGYVAETFAQSDTNATSTTSTSYTNVPNATQSVTVPSGETDKLIVLFSGESACYGGTAIQKCLLKITVDGTELSPAAGSDAFFDNNDQGVKTTSVTGATSPYTVVNSFNSKTSGDQEEHGVVRTSSNLSAGSHTVQVSYSTTDSGTAFQLDDWSLVVLRVKVA